MRQGHPYLTLTLYILLTTLFLIDKMAYIYNIISWRKTVKYSRISSIVTVMLLFSSLLFITGCGPDVKAQRKAAGLLNSFETTASDSAIGDFELETNGYVSLEQIKKYSSQGKFSAKATFSVPVDFLTTTQAARSKDSWVDSVTMGINTLTPLKVTDWSVYKKFDIDVYVADPQAPDLTITLVDAHGNQYTASRPLKNGRNKLELLVDDVKTARVDVAAITSFSLSMDTKNQPKDVVIYLDNIRLAL
jgi:hypothetical protein